MALTIAGLKAALDAAFAADALAELPEATAVRDDVHTRLATAIITYLVANNTVAVETADGPGAGSFS